MVLRVVADQGSALRTNGTDQALTILDITDLWQLLISHTRRAVDWKRAKKLNVVVVRLWRLLSWVVDCWNEDESGATINFHDELDVTAIVGNLVGWPLWMIERVDRTWRDVSNKSHHKGMLENERKRLVISRQE